MNPAHFKPRHGLILASLVLGACQQSTAPDATTSDVATPAVAPDAKPGITLRDGMLRLPVVKGNPGVAYFTVANSGPSAATLVAVHIDGVGKAEMHETAGGSMQPLKEVPVPAGGSVAFAQGGKHVMLFDLDANLAAGDTTEMTLVFAGGDKASILLKVNAVGMKADAAGMDHGH